MKCTVRLIVVSAWYFVFQKNDVSAATKTLTEHGETVFELGEIQTRAPNNPRVILQ